MTGPILHDPATAPEHNRRAVHCACLECWPQGYAPCAVNLTGDAADPVLCRVLSRLPHHECGEHHDSATSCAEAGRLAERAMAARLIPVADRRPNPSIVGRFCRCGHGRQYHRPTPNALAKLRKRGRARSGRAQDGCRFGAAAAGRKVCPCRDWHPVAEKG